jgi:hypothetical protein
MTVFELEAKILKQKITRVISHTLLNLDRNAKCEYRKSKKYNICKKEYVPVT